LQGGSHRLCKKPADTVQTVEHVVLCLLERARAAIDLRR
jgi:hypothetical protein